MHVYASDFDHMGRKLKLNIKYKISKIISVEKNIRQKNNRKKYHAFTLVEMMVSLFIFSIVVTIVIATFVQMVNVRKQTKAIQQDMEEARTAMELMAKNIRMSSDVQGDGTMPSKTIYMFNNSQGECISYEISGNALEQEMIPVPAGGDGLYCVPANFPPGGYASVTSSDIASLSPFSIIPTSSSVMGRVTIALQVTNGSDKENIQTTVSLRDYSEISPQ